MHQHEHLSIRCRRRNYDHEIQETWHAESSAFDTRIDTDRCLPRDFTPRRDVNEVREIVETLTRLLENADSI